MESDDKHTKILIDQDSHDSHSEANSDLKLIEEMTPERSENESDLPIHLFSESPKIDKPPMSNLSHSLNNVNISPLSIFTPPSSNNWSASSSVCDKQSGNIREQSNDFTLPSFQSTFGFPATTILTSLQNKTPSQNVVSTTYSRPAAQSVYFAPDLNNKEIETEIYKNKVGNLISKQCSTFTSAKSNKNEKSLKCSTDCQIYNENEKPDSRLSNYQIQPQMSQSNNIRSTSSSVCILQSSNISSQASDITLPSFQSTFGYLAMKVLPQIHSMTPSLSSFNSMFRPATQSFFCAPDSESNGEVVTELSNNIKLNKYKVTNQISKESKKKSYKCNICKATFTKPKNIYRHKKCHSAKIQYACHICNKRFNKKIHLFKHKIFHTTKTPYLQKSALYRHKIVNTAERRFVCNTSNKKNPVCPEAVPMSNNIYAGDICNKTLTQKYDMNNEGLFAKKNLIWHKKNQDKRTFLCDKCGVTFNEKSSLTVHKYKHTDKKAFACNECSKKFKSKCELFRHKIIHRNERIFACDKCSKKFKQRRDLISHECQHSEGRPFGCDECNKTFKYKSSIYSHKNEHSNERLFVCDECNMTFKQKRYLMRHKILHTDKRRFACDECDMTFKQKRYLMHHKIKHTDKRPFDCDECDKTFKYKSDLNRHKNEHSDERPFVCDECNKTFKQKRYLLCHKIQHTDKRPFECDKCDKTFKYKSDLNKHKKKHSEQ